VPAGSGTTRRYVLPQRLRSASWAVVQGTRCVLYSLIVVHEEVGDECAHARLLADINLL
jgi:hypothetical protein